MSGKIPPHEEGQRSKLLTDMENTLVENLKFAAERMKKVWNMKYSYTCSLGY